MSDNTRDYFVDYDQDYPVGIVLKESESDREKANKIEKELSKNKETASLIGALGGLGVFGLSSYLTAKKLYPNVEDKIISYGIPTLLGGLIGLKLGKTTAPILNRYINYKKMSKKEGINTSILNYSDLDEGSQVAKLLKKDNKKIEEYQKINTKLKLAEMTAGSLASGATFGGFALAGYPIVGAVTKHHAYDLAGNYAKNKMYNNLLS